MLWKEDESATDEFKVSDEITDLVYAIQCRSVPVDHAHALSHAIHRALPWFTDEPDAGMHMIHISEAANGWSRQDNPDTELLLSRRSKLILRLPKHRLDDARQLTGMKLDIAGNTMMVGKSSVKPFSPLSTLFSRYVQSADIDNEEQFLNYIVPELEALLNTEVRKILCGKSHTLNTPEGPIRTKSVMVADLSPESAILLQQKGLGAGRKIGCGLFIPHKGIKAVKDTH